MWLCARRSSPDIDSRMTWVSLLSSPLASAFASLASALFLVLEILKCVLEATDRLSPSVLLCSRLRRRELI